MKANPNHKYIAGIDPIPENGGSQSVTVFTDEHGQLASVWNGVDMERFKRQKERIKRYYENVKLTEETVEGAKRIRAYQRLILFYMPQSYFPNFLSAVIKGTILIAAYLFIYQLFS
jgi:hypothetical protein